MDLSYKEDNRRSIVTLHSCFTLFLLLYNCYCVVSGSAKYFFFLNLLSLVSYKHYVFHPFDYYLILLLVFCHFFHGYINFDIKNNWGFITITWTLPKTQERLLSHFVSQTSSMQNESNETFSEL